MCQILDDEQPCVCSDDDIVAVFSKEAATRRLEALYEPLLGAQVTAQVVPIPTTSYPARRPVMPYTSSPLLDHEHHWGVVTS